MLLKSLNPVRSRAHADFWRASVIVSLCFLVLGMVGCAHTGGKSSVGHDPASRKGDQDRRGTDILFPDSSLPGAAQGPYSTGPARFVGTDRLAFSSGSWLLVCDLEAPRVVVESYDLKFIVHGMEARGSRILAWSREGQVAVVNLESRTTEMRLTLARPPEWRREPRWNPEGTCFAYINEDHQLVAHITTHEVSYLGPGGAVIAENVVDCLFIDEERIVVIQASGDRFSGDRHLLIHDLSAAHNPVVRWEAEYHPRRLYNIGREGYIGALSGYVLLRINLSDNSHTLISDEELLDPLNVGDSEIAFSPDGANLLVPDPETASSLLVLDARSGELRGALALEHGLIGQSVAVGTTSVEIHPDGDLVLVESYAQLELLSIRERGQVALISRRWDGPGVVAGQDGRSVYVVDADALYKCTPGADPESVVTSERIVGSELLFSPQQDFVATFFRRGSVLTVVSVRDDAASLRLSFRSEYGHGGDYLHAWWEDDSTLRFMGQRDGVIELMEWRPDYDEARVLATAEVPRNVEVVMGDGVAAYGRYGPLHISGAGSAFGEWRQIGMPFSGRLVGFSGQTRLWVLARTGQPHIFDTVTERWQAIDLPMPYPIQRIHTYTYTNRVLIQDIRDIIWLYEELDGGEYRIRQVSPHPIVEVNLAPGPEDRAAIAGVCPHTGRVRLVRMDTSK